MQIKDFPGDTPYREEIVRDAVDPLTDGGSCIAGPDGEYGNTDDCSDGFEPAEYHLSAEEDGGSLTVYCTEDLNPIFQDAPPRVVSFRQH